MRISTVRVSSPRAAIVLTIISLLTVASIPSNGRAGSLPARASHTRLRPLTPTEPAAEPVASVKPSVQDEQPPALEAEAATARRKAEAVKPGSLTTGTLESDAGTPAQRLYRFEASEGDWAITSFALEIGAQPGNFDTTVSVLDANGTALPVAYTNKTVGILAEEGQLYASAIPATGTYFVRVTGSSATPFKDSVGYALVLSLTQRPTYRISPLVIAGKPLLAELHRLVRQSEALDREIEAFGRTPETGAKQKRIMERIEAVRAQTHAGFDSNKVLANSVCTAGTLSGTESTYVRPSTGSTAGSCTLSTNTVRYDSYEFTLTGCTTFPTTVNITLCDPTCAAPDTSFDSFLAVYQAPGGGSGSFTAGSPCTNFVAQNADDVTAPACPNGTGGFPVLSTVSATLNSGSFVVVVSSQFATSSPGANATGTYNLFVSAASAGCNVASGSCTPITVTPSPNPPASSVTINTAYPSTTFTGSGGTGPYGYVASGLPSGMSIHPTTGVLSGTPTQAGLFQPVITATDSNACSGNFGFSLTVTNVALPCITDRLTTGSTAFSGVEVDDGTATGIEAPCAPRPVSLFYKAYEFNLTGCTSATLTATTCGSGGCSPLTGTGALPDSIVYVYRSGGSLTAGTGTSGAFNPASPCTNLVALNDQQGLASSGGLGACGANGNLAGLTRTIGPGRFTVVVSSAFPGNVGAFNLSVAVAGSGCTLALAGACSVAVTPSPNPVPVGAVNTPFTTTTFAGSGGTAPYTFTHSGTVPPGMTFVDATATLSGTPTQQGFYPLTVIATDANNCIGSISVNVLITGGSPPCITDAVTAGGPTFDGPNRDDTVASGINGPCSLRGVNLLYKAYEFNVSGCASATLTASTCGSGGCPPLTGSGALADSIIYIYRTGGSLTAGTGMTGAFNPASPCTNLVAINDQQGLASSGGLGACAADADLSGLIRTIGPGVFTIVVSGAFSNNSGGFNLNVNLSGSGCNLCPVVTGTVSGGGTICPGNAANVAVSIVGGTAPYTVTLDNGGGTQTSASPVNFSVSPTSTTTYSVLSATDATGCPVNVTGSATVTVQSQSINPTSMSFGATGGSDSVSVTSPGCPWTAVSNDSWIMITSGMNGTGNGTVNYTVVANTGPARSGTMTIANQTFTVNQSDGCSFTINPTSMSFSSAGGSDSVAVTASDSACMWSATSNDSWITVTSCHSKTNGVVPGCTFTGSGFVDYSVGANPNTTSRVGTITVAGQTFTVNQAGACAPPTPSSITGSTSVIAGDADLDNDGMPGYTYSVPSQTGVTYAWSVSSGATIYSGQGTTAIQVVYDNSAGPFTVSVLVTSACGSDNPSLATSKLHDGFAWQFVGSGAPGGWTTEVGTWLQNSGFENPMHVVTAPGGTLYESVSYGQVYGDFTYEASLVVSRSGATVGAASTLWYRGTPTPLVASSAQRWNSGYAFNIANTGKFSIFRYTSTGNTTLQSWVLPMGTTIHTDGVTPNVLRIVANGGTVQFSINGTLVKTLTGQSLFPTGKVGVGMIRTSTSPTDVLKVVEASLAPSGFVLPKSGFAGEVVRAEQEAANREANRLRPVANPFFDREQ
jgi:hypothetical protein